MPAPLRTWALVLPLSHKHNPCLVPPRSSVLPLDGLFSHLDKTRPEENGGLFSLSWFGDSSVGALQAEVTLHRDLNNQGLEVWGGVVTGGAGLTWHCSSFPSTEEESCVSSLWKLPRSQNTFFFWTWYLKNTRYHSIYIYSRLLLTSQTICYFVPSWQISKFKRKKNSDSIWKTKIFATSIFYKKHQDVEVNPKNNDVSHWGCKAGFTASLVLTEGSNMLMSHLDWRTIPISHSISTSGCRGDI